MSDNIRDEVIIALVDLSGSMTGRASSAIGYQLFELLSALRDKQEDANNSIRLGILAFHETAYWIIKPTQVNQIQNLPELNPVPGNDGLGRKSNYAEMLKELNNCMTERFLCETRALHDLHLLLFTDGCPTDKSTDFIKAMELIRKNPIFSNTHTKRYIVKENKKEIHFSGMENHVDMTDYLKIFASNEQNIVSADDFSTLQGDIINELVGKEKLESVFD